ncbi:hypothetical protein [Burkholderia lata]|uniref:Uncharacterized protein n=1 Tax=Burkholderia lata (strain ATCC 17760 / DSM 23089 / LMG 22485 / NCIMB 9086 / R18194 / 383) TaxID=482957 RepID=A0A6P2U3C8_BURL3|nr:hypothetical protein [Burkholderia lata]VWC69341.1 hypothetical protein BLA18109_02371 [Burkholderia lata]
MHSVRVVWFSKDEGGRKQPPVAGKYYSVSRFPEDFKWQSNAWSVVFDLKDPYWDGARMVSLGDVDFLVKDAPTERMINHKSFYIYEGPKKVGEVAILD